MFDQKLTKLLFDSIFENLPIMLLVKDASTLKIERWNKESEKILGTSDNDFLVEEGFENLKSIQIQSFLEHDSQVVKEKRTVVVEDKIVTLKDVKILLTKKVPIFDEEGNPKYLVWMSEDITEKRKIERDFSAQQGMLEDFVDVLGMVGHELRTPLAGLRALSEFIMADETFQQTSPIVQRYARNITEEVSRMAGTVNDLLEVARLNSGNVRWNWSTVNLKQTLEDALAPIIPLIDHSKITFKLVVDEGLQMTGDVAAIRRLAVNLLSNSCKHTKIGSIEIKAKQISSEQAFLEGMPKSSITLTVFDTGCGIPEKIAAWLGEPFAFSVGPIGANLMEGVGLGLAICKGIVSAHNGKIIIQSKEGEGTKVTILLAQDLMGPVEIKRETKIISETI